MNANTMIETLLRLKQYMKTENQKFLIDSLIIEIETEGFSVQIAEPLAGQIGTHTVSEKLRRKVADLSAQAVLEILKHVAIGTAIEEFMRLWDKFGD